MADDVWRIDYQMPEDADPEAISRSEVAGERLRKQLGPDVDFEFVWIGPYGYRDHLLDDFRHGRVLFIGDAAHVVSPFGARGGNTGIQDAANLGWKLALVAQAAAPESLLDSYSAERRAAAAENLQVTSRSARFLAPRSPAEHTLRRAVVALARQHAFARPLVNTGRMSVPNDYPVSACLPQGARSVQNLALTHSDGTATRLTQLLQGTALLALWWGATAAELDAAAALSQRYPLQVLAVDSAQAGLRDVDGRLAAHLNAGPGQLCLVRPDGYLAATLAAPDSAALEAAVRVALSLE